MNTEQETFSIFNDMIRALQSHVELKAVILFGSRARGTFHKYSDHDLVIIGDFTGPYFDRLGWVMDLTPDVSVDLFCYTPSEFEQMFKTYRLTAIDAIGEGIVLFGEAFISPYKKRHAEFVRRGMRKTSCVLIPPTS